MWLRSTRLQVATQRKPISLWCTCSIDSKDNFRVEPLDPVSARALLCSNAFGSVAAPVPEQLIKDVIGACGRLPLSLVVIGKALQHDVARIKPERGRRRLTSAQVAPCWSKVLENLRAAEALPGSPEDKLFRRLNVTYAALSDPSQGATSEQERILLSRAMHAFLANARAHCLERILAAARLGLMHRADALLTYSSSSWTLWPWTCSGARSSMLGSSCNRCMATAWIWRWTT